jgi:uncharacterized protein involved in exopolysaccharide biosynthesis
MGQNIASGPVDTAIGEYGYDEDDERDTLIEGGTLVLRWRKTIAILGFSFGLVGLLSGLLSPRQYKSTLTFLPEAEPENASAIALAASQLGFQLSSSSGDWWPAIYVEALKSRALLDPIARGTVTVTEEGSKEIPLADLLKIKGGNDEEKITNTVRRLREIINVGEDVKIRAVKLEAITQWPSVSYQLAQKLVKGVNDFNVQSRKTSASAERKFVEAQTVEAERMLRAAEARLQEFLQRNRVVTSPQLLFEQDRLQREVAIRQDVYATLARSREEARIREVRNTPVLTILEAPRIAAIGEPRGSVLRALLGGLLGGIVGILLAFGWTALRRTRESSDAKTQELMAVLYDATPRFLRSWMA